MKETFARLLGAVVILGVFFSVAMAIYLPIAWWQKARAETWPSRKGVITKSYAHYIPGHGDAEHGGSPAAWMPEMSGTYPDNGEEFRVTRVRFGGARFGDGEASVREDVAKYHVGRVVDVYYCPENPRETILESRTPWTAEYTEAGLAVGFLVLARIAWAYRRKRFPAPTTFPGVG